MILIEEPWKGILMARPKMSTNKTETEPSNQELMKLVLSMQARLEEYERGGAVKPTRIARGTPKPERAAPLTTAEKIQDALLGLPKTSEEIAKHIGESLHATSTELEKMEKAAKVTRLNRGANILRWALRPGGGSDALTRRAVIIGLLMHEPLETWEILQILGVEDRKLVENDIIEIRRNEPVWWMNKGVGGGKGRSNVYWISQDRKEPPAEFDGRLARKKR